ncbi:MAG: protoporphyrinogen oxidase HemJ [Alphaproteobacteria bacterium]|nr:protoporphyrinogen oxidase HemJ [Alphaproteobacteria bacterium]
MSETLLALYPWMKSFHIIAVIAWMAGMLYLPRLFVYHCETAPGTPEYERFKVMERKLMRIIINPSMIVVWVLGLILAETLHAWTETWFILKLILVTALSALHGMLSRWRRDFEHGRNTKTQRFYRIVNEVPAVLMAFIVILVVVKPF